MELKFILEALLFHSQKPQSPAELKQMLAAAALGSEDEQVRAFKKTSLDDISTALRQLEADHEAAGRSFRLTCVSGAWQFVNQPEYAPWLRVILGERSRPPRLSQPALETLTIIAYRQPLTRTEMEQIRGVSVDGVMQTLLERGLIEAVGRAEVVGRPVIYATTPAFLEYFGLRSLDELPAAEELRRIPVTRPEALPTVDPKLATAPAETTPELPLQDVLSASESAGDGSADRDTAIESSESDEQTGPNRDADQKEVDSESEASDITDDDADDDDADDDDADDDEDEADGDGDPDGDGSDKEADASRRPPRKPQEPD